MRELSSESFQVKKEMCEPSIKAGVSSGVMVTRSLGISVFDEEGKVRYTTI